MLLLNEGIPWCQDRKGGEIKCVDSNEPFSTAIECQGVGRVDSRPRCTPLRENPRPSGGRLHLRSSYPTTLCKKFQFNIKHAVWYQYKMLYQAESTGKDTVGSIEIGTQDLKSYKPKFDKGG